MSTSALITMIIAWAIILFLVTRFLIKVIRTPQHKEDQQH